MIGRILKTKIIIFLLLGIGAGMTGEGNAENQQRESFLRVDLTGFFNNDGIAWASNKSDTNLEGAGRYGLPAEYLPESNSSFVFHSIPFTFPSKENGLNNNIRCGGQVIKVKEGHYARICILGVGTAVGATPGRFVFNYTDGSKEEAILSFTDYCFPSMGGEWKAICFPHRYDQGRIGIHSGCLWFQMGNLNREKVLSKIKLPETKFIGIFAITLAKEEIEVPRAEKVKAKISKDIVYLSDISPIYVATRAAKFHGFHNILYQEDRSLAGTIGSELTLNGITYERGIGCATNFVLAYALDGQYRTLEAIVGIDDRAEDNDKVTLEVYTDDEKVWTGRISKKEPIHLKVPVEGRRELIFVGRGKEGLLFDLCDARLKKSEKAVETRRQEISLSRMVRLDEKLAIRCEVLLLGRNAKPIDGQGGENNAKNLGGYGRVTSSPGCNMWAGIRDKGDTLRWSVLLKKGGKYRVYARVISSGVGKKPSAEDYAIRIDGFKGKQMSGKIFTREMLPEDKFENRLWGYIYVDFVLNGGLHDVEVKNVSGEWLALDRVLFVLLEEKESIAIKEKELSLVRNPEPYEISERWKRKLIKGEDFISFDEGKFFPRAEELGLKFFSSITRSWHVPLQDAIKAGIPFFVNARFTSEPLSPPSVTYKMTEDEYKRVKQKTGEDFLGFVPTEWPGCFNYGSNKPATRREAYERYKEWYQKQASCLFNDISPMAAGWLWDHYAGEWGKPGGIYNEAWTGSGNHLCLLFARGAARQYGARWHSFIAPGRHDLYSWVVPDYMVGKRPKSTVRGPDCCGSMSLIKRIFYLSYMWGANSTENESPAYETNIGTGDRVEPSPMGEAIGRFYEFVRKHPDRGDAYTPVGIMLDLYHGWAYGYLYPERNQNLTWRCLPVEPGDYMKQEFFNVIYPGSFEALNEKNVFVNTPYGDIFDVMLSTASLEHIKSYKVLFLLGDLAVDMDEELAGKLIAYVKNGGTLVINAKQVTDSLPQEFLGLRLKGERKAKKAICKLDGVIMNSQGYTYQKAEVIKDTSVVVENETGDALVTIRDYGKGRVILTMPYYMLQDNFNGLPLLPHLLEHVTNGLLPCRVIGDIEYTVNRNNTGWVVTLVNNRGVYKLPRSPAVISKEKKERVRLIFEEEPEEVYEWREEKALSYRKSGGKFLIEVDVPPGEVRIVEIGMGKNPR